jgi:hypothetical protein
VCHVGEEGTNGLEDREEEAKTATTTTTVLHYSTNRTADAKKRALAGGKTLGNPGLAWALVSAERVARW